MTTMTQMLNDRLASAASSGDLYMVQLTLLLGAKDLNGALLRAARRGRLGTLEELIHQGATDLNGAMVEAAGNNHLEAARLLLIEGATDIDRAIDEAEREGSHETMTALTAMALRVPGSTAPLRAHQVRQDHHDFMRRLAIWEAGGT